MKALTVSQPWAALIAAGEKRVENRSWQPGAALQVGDLLAIHAGKRAAPKYDLHGFEMDRGIAPAEEARRVGVHADARGSVIAVVKFEGAHHGAPAGDPDVVCCGDRYAIPDCWHWQVSDPYILREPITVVGALGLWNLPADAATAVMAQIAEAVRRG